MLESTSALEPRCIQLTFILTRRPIMILTANPTLTHTRMAMRTRILDSASDRLGAADIGMAVMHSTAAHTGIGGSF